MTRYLLDTDLCIEVMRDRAPGVVDRLRALGRDEAALSTITLAELQYGVARSARPVENQTLLFQFCAAFAIVPFDEVAAQAYGDVRAQLEKAGTPISPLDTLIAAHALSLGLTLLTSNEREFRRVSALKVENWLTER